MCTATILEPTGFTETPIKFIAGLVAAIPLEAEIMHIKDPSFLRVRVKYPDQHARISVPRTGDLRKLDPTNENGNYYNIIIIIVIVSHVNDC